MLLVDVGSIPHRPRTKDSEHSERTFPKEEGEHSIHTSGPETFNSRIVDACGSQNLNSRLIRDECVWWGVGDRVGLFILIQRIFRKVQSLELEPILESEKGKDNIDDRNASAKLLLHAKVREYFCQISLKIPAFFFCLFYIVNE